MQATAVAATLSGAPSTFHALWRHRDLRAVLVSVGEATRAVGTLLPPRRRGLIRGTIAHIGISAICGQALARTLPEHNSVGWGAVAGLATGVINVGVIGRRFPEIRALPFLPQLADNVAFGAVFALVVDR